MITYLKFGNEMDSLTPYLYTILVVLKNGARSVFPQSVLSALFNALSLSNNVLLMLIK